MPCSTHVKAVFKGETFEYPIVRQNSIVMKAGEEKEGDT